MAFTFGTKKETTLQFSTKGDAYLFSLNHLMNEKGMDMLEASKKASEFAREFAENTGIPDKLQPEQKGIQKTLSSVKDVMAFANENPIVLEGLKTLIGLGATFFVGKEVGEEEAKDRKPNNNKDIDFTKIREEYELETNSDNGGLSE